MPGKPRALSADRCGATSVEYALVAALVAMMALAGISTLGKNTRSLWDRLGAEIGNVI